MQIERLIPLISIIDHPNVDLYSLRTHNSFSSSSRVKLDEMTTGKVDPSPIKAYFRCVGNGLSSKFGGFSIEGIGLGSLCSRSLNGLFIKIGKLGSRLLLVLKFQDQ